MGLNVILLGEQQGASIFSVWCSLGVYEHSVWSASMPLQCCGVSCCRITALGVTYSL